MTRIVACLLLIALPGFHGSHQFRVHYAQWMFQDDGVPDETHVTHDT